MSDDDLLDGLNPVQHEAVTHADGPLLSSPAPVRARPGCSPTASPTSSRDEGVSPFEILAITFTNKAADEMKHRVGRARRPGRRRRCGCPPSTRPACASCAATPAGSATRRRSPSTTRPTPSASPATCIRDLNLDPKRFPPRSVHATISAAKNDGVGVDEYAERAEAHLRAQDRRRLPRVPGPPAARPAPWTSTTCSATPSSCSSSHPDVLEHYQRRFRHVLVDEYQDTNPVQNELVLHARRQEHRNVCVVGDSDQCLPARHARRARPTAPCPIEQIAGRRRGARHRRRRRARSPGTVTAVTPGRYAGPVVRVRAGGRELAGTPHHIVPAPHRATRPDQWFVYLM